MFPNSALNRRVSPVGPHMLPATLPPPTLPGLVAGDPAEAVVAEDEVQDVVVLRTADVRAVGGRCQDHGGHPPAGRDERGHAHHGDLPHPPPPSGRRREQVDDGHHREDQEGLHHLGDEAESHQRTGEDEPLRLRPLEAARGGVEGAREQQGEHGVGIVVAEHERRHRRERDHGAPEDRSLRAEPAPDGQVDKADGCHALERLRRQHAPRVEPEDAGRDLHRPEEGRRLVDGDEIGRVGGPEEERLPALGARLHGRGVEGVAPPARPEVPQVEDGGGGEQREECGPHPGRVALLAPHEASHAPGPRAGRPVAESRARALVRAGVEVHGPVEHPDGGIGGGREVRHGDISKGAAPGRAEGRKIQARSTANRNTAAARLATVIATSSGSRAPGATVWATTRPSVVKTRLTA